MTTYYERNVVNEPNKPTLSDYTSALFDVVILVVFMVFALKVLGIV